MNRVNASAKWNGNMSFTCVNRQIQSITDAPEESGGKNEGPTPKELILNGMMGCTAMDVVTILKKMRVPEFSLELSIEANKTLTTPSYFSHAKINYYLKFPNESQNEELIKKVIKAVNSSMTKHCGVNYMLSKICEITYEIFFNDMTICQEKVNFIDPK